jgi:transmembrane 9 superfamily protein 3
MHIKTNLVYTFILLVVQLINCDEHTHKYELNEEVVLWVNTVGPYHNRQETYPYFSLPFCLGNKPAINHYHETLGENLLGVELEFSGLFITYKGDQTKTMYCSVELTKDKFDLFAYAIKNHYWYQMYTDDLPIWGIVGDYDEKEDAYYLWTHKKFEFGYNDPYIVDVNLTSESKVKLSPGIRVEFSYEVLLIRLDLYFCTDKSDKSHLFAGPMEAISNFV